MDEYPCGNGCGATTPDEDGLCWECLEAEEVFAVAEAAACAAGV